MKTIGGLFTGFMAMLLVLGCGENKSSPDQQEPETATAVMLLYDVSASTLPEQRARYVEYGSNVWKEVSKKSSTIARPAAVCAALITGKGVAEEQVLFNVVAPKYAFVSMGSTATSDRIRAQTAAAGKKVEQGLSRLMTSKLPHTAILDGLDLAQRFFDSHPKANKVLYIFSDMIEQSDRLNMGDAKVKLNAAAVTKFIEKEREQGLIPKLDGVRVIVCGAKAKDPASYRLSRGFWLEYMKATGAVLSPKDYGTTFRLPSAAF